MGIGTVILWIVTITLLALCLLAAIAGIVAAIRGPRDGGSMPTASAYIAGTIGGGKTVAWTDAKARAAAERCGATYVSIVRGAASSTTVVRGPGGRVSVTGNDGLDAEAARLGVPVPYGPPPFDRAYNRSILMLMDRVLNGRHIRIYLLRYAEPYEGSRYEELRHENLTALIVAQDPGLPAAIESMLTNVIAGTGTGRTITFTNGGTRFLAAVAPDSSAVAAAYDAIAKL
ncbi:hypothetical protein Uis4E_0643 [Bifidobacterium parmae]|uniref:Uncharacterized protein n=2 Tax=Bifidobacterium parmae TaxID=361854 RepID=A0A2N5J4U5_9BIFI|nr:hypothetical protein Uis4E_0643 [Bifidobacterium parmae]